MKPAVKHLVEGLQSGNPTPFFHKGEWAVHEVLPILLSSTGKAHVSIATFSVSEDSLRPLFFSIDSGAIASLRLLLDFTVQRHKMDMLGFASHITPHIRIASNHAKLLLIENEQHHVTLLGSANLNTNARWENGVLFSDRNMFDFFSAAFSQAYETAQPWNL